MAGMEGSVEQFLEDSVATLTRKFECDMEDLDDLSPPDRAAVAKAIADVNRKLAKEWAGFYAASRRRLLLKRLQQLNAAALAAPNAGTPDGESGSGGSPLQRRRGKRARDVGDEEDGAELTDSDEARMELIGRCVELRERLSIVRQRQERVCRLASAASDLSSILQKLAPSPTRASAGSGGALGDTAATVASGCGSGEGSEVETGSGKEGEGAGGGRGLLGEALAVELDSANYLLSQLVPLLQHSSGR